MATNSLHEFLIMHLTPEKIAKCDGGSWFLREGNGPPQCPIAHAVMGTEFEVPVRKAINDYNDKFFDDVRPVPPTEGVAKALGVPVEAVRTFINNWDETAPGCFDKWKTFLNVLGTIKPSA